MTHDPRTLLATGEHMDSSGRGAWIRIVLVGGLYLLVGRVFASSTLNVPLGRRAAWAISAIIFAAHIAYEQARARTPPRTTAMRAALGVAVGSFGLALAGMLYSFSTPAGFRPIWLFALVALPLLGVPAFVVALVVALLLRRVSPSAPGATERGGSPDPSA
jgi:hypothetical protein